MRNLRCKPSREDLFPGDGYSSGGSGVRPERSGGLTTLTGPDRRAHCFSSRWKRRMTFFFPGTRRPPRRPVHNLTMIKSYHDVGTGIMGIGWITPNDEDGIILLSQ